MVDLSIIIVSYNTRELTVDCLRSLYAETKEVEFEVIVVDNNSTDKSEEAILENFPQVHLLALDENLGFAGGNNLGVKEAQGRRLLLLNPDTIVPSRTLNQTIQYIDEHDDIGVLTCAVELWSGKLDWDAHRGFPTPWVALTRLIKLNSLFPNSKLFNLYNQGWKNINTIHEVDSVVGAFMLVPRKIGELIGWWDEDYFLNGEDIDFCYRVKEKGYKVVYYPPVKIIHHRGASKGTRTESQSITHASSEGKLRVANASIDSMSIFYNKHLRNKYPRIMNVFVDVGLLGIRLIRKYKIRQKIK
ncbi:glycosyl transferase family 2 [Candidatus Uhrbacteria bacterium CG_4_10_14_0_2_um_filter_41_7]|nr:MAG: glycosyl transferase family 2 [Candidatus Uhrbacteria bacterium CG_4_10_14_0_2_um_filter_41_7]